MGYSFRLAAMGLLYASFHRQYNTHHGHCYTSRGALAGTRNSSMCCCFVLFLFWVFVCFLCVLLLFVWLVFLCVLLLFVWLVFFGVFVCFVAFCLVGVFVCFVAFCLVGVFWCFCVFCCFLFGWCFLVFFVPRLSGWVGVRPLRFLIFHVTKHLTHV